MGHTVAEDMSPEPEGFEPRAAAVADTSPEVPSEAAPAEEGTAGELPVDIAGADTRAGPGCMSADCRGSEAAGDTRPVAGTAEVRPGSVRSGTAVLSVFSLPDAGSKCFPGRCNWWDSPVRLSG